MTNTTLHELTKSQPPFGSFIGMKLLSVDDSEVVGELTVTEDLSNRNGVMHGGAIMGFADNLAGTATCLSLPKGQNTTTIESKTNFLRAIPLGDTISARCIKLHNGKTTVVLQTTILREDKKIAAITTQTQLIFKFHSKG